MLNEAGTAAGGQISVLNLNAGGTLRTNRVRIFAETGSNAFVNFNGGTLKASGIPAQPLISQSGNDYISGSFVTYVYSGGGTIDNGGFNTGTIPTPLTAPTGSGVTSIGVTNGGAGYIGAPAVVLSGGNGLGATAVANINPATGTVTGITVTNPGSGYSPGDVLTATLSGGGATTPATVGTINLAANVGGGMTFTGSGNTTFASTSTYTGATLVTGGGTLTLRSADPAVVNSVAGSINASSGITVGTVASSGKLVQTSTVAISTPVSIVNGSLSGNGTVNTVTISSGAANSIASNNTSTGPLTIGSLTYSGAGAMNLTTSPGTATTPVLPVTTLAANGAANSVTINAANTSGGWANGTYQLVSFTGSIGGTGFPAFTAALTGLGTRQTSSLTNPTGLIDLVIGGDSAVWTGKLSGDWTTTVQAAPKNWALSTSSAPTDYVSGDAVVMDDTATGTTNVNIATANVTPALVSFNNSTKNYSIGSTGGFVIAGTGGMILNGTGTVALNTPNTFSGGVIVNSGTLDLGSTATATSSAVGTGRLTLAQGTTLDNTSGAAVTLPNNPVTLNGDFIFTGTNSLNLGTGAVTINDNATHTNAGTLTINLPGKSLTVGGLISGTSLGLSKDGPGTLVLSGGGTFPGQSRVLQGVLTVAGGTLNFSNGNAPSLAAGNRPNDNTSIFVNSGTLNTTSEIWLGSDANAYGSMTVNGGAVNVGSWLALGRATGGGGAPAGIGLINVNGGTVTIQSNNLTIGSFGVPGSGGLGQVTVNPGGTVATTGNTGVFAGENFTGYLSVLGNGTTQSNVNISAASGNGLIVGNAGGATNSVVNLGQIGATGITNNGRITTPAPSAAVVVVARSISTAARCVRTLITSA